ncbi:MAG: hypothetical protein A3F72_00305 [Bacteroidetes bacterium RIFCSPLOWO2_12_FULL_35_15]|nr:MAG: hypothetical protein A3F72_00305 [Bacteroidetes bacterium RIFCSPLOWO2_12_FULL_35_15]
MFVRFIEQIKIRLKEPLPGEDAQLLMAPSRRQFPEEFLVHPNAKKSAVLILLFPFNNSIHTILIQRPVYEGVHSGQVSFPGGKYEESDLLLSFTALREASEEVGIKTNTVEIIGKLTDLYIRPSNFLVSPFIAYTGQVPDFVIDNHEVQKIISVDLFALDNNEIRSEKTILHSSGSKIKTPYYEIEGLTVWGATAMIISELNRIVNESKIISF